MKLQHRGVCGLWVALSERGVTGVVQIRDEGDAFVEVISKSKANVCRPPVIPRLLRPKRKREIGA